MKKETRGRPKLENPSMVVSWRLPYDVNQILQRRRETTPLKNGKKVPLSQVFNEIVRESENK